MSEDGPEPSAYVLRHNCGEDGLGTQQLVWANIPFPHECRGCGDLLDEEAIHSELYAEGQLEAFVEDLFSDLKERLDGEDDSSE